MAEEYQKKFNDIPLPPPESLLPPSKSTSNGFSKNFGMKPPRKVPATSVTKQKNSQQTNETNEVKETITETTTTTTATTVPEPNDRKLQIFVSFFELLGKNASDLLNEKKPIAILEDKFGEIQLSGILEKQVSLLSFHLFLLMCYTIYFLKDEKDIYNRRI